MIRLDSQLSMIRAAKIMHNVKISFAFIPDKNKFILIISAVDVHVLLLLILLLASKLHPHGFSFYECRIRFCDAILLSMYVISVNSASPVYHRRMYFTLFLFVYEIAAYMCKCIRVSINYQ